MLGVSPRAQGTGLGRVLLHQGLDYLTKRGFRTVILYVDGDNTAAVRLYEQAGFHTRSVDLEYRLRGLPALAPCRPDGGEIARV